MIDKNLLEVFNYYCRKFVDQRGGDFSKLDKNLYQLGLNGFNRFCKDFRVPLDNQGITLAWKKASNNHLPHEFEQFSRSIGVLGFMINRQKAETIKKRNTELRKEQKKRQQGKKEPEAQEKKEEVKADPDDKDKAKEGQESVDKKNQKPVLSRA